LPKVVPGLPEIKARRDEPREPELLPPPHPVVRRIVLTTAQEPQETAAFQRRNRATEEELRQQLAGAEEVGLGRDGERVYRRYTYRIRKNEIGSKGPADSTAIWSLRPDMLMLPMRDGQASMLGRKAATELGALSRKLHVYLDAIAPAGPDGRPMPVLRQRLRQDLRGKKPEWLRGEAVPTLTQMLMADDAATRRLLVELLAAIPQEPATLALAQRAAFDLDAGVRAAAVEALKDRDPEVSRPVLLKALRYPWPPPADFAAEALVHLKDRGAVSELVGLLREPRPGRPYVTPDRRVVIREVVKINHQRNCVLCHVPSLSGKDPVVGVDPVPVRPPPEWGGGGSGAGGKWSRGGRGSSSSTSAGAVTVLVRADITFLRQDFSVGFPVANPAQQVPQLQQAAQGNPALDRAIRTPPPPVRFDFVVRTRPVQKGERKKWQGLDEQSNPHRDAVLFTLRQLTGQDHGDSTDAWVRAFPQAEAEVRSVKLAERLVRAEPLPRAGLLQQYRDGAGVEYTWALARAIPRLSGPQQEVARLALVNRLAKLPAPQLRQQLGDRNLEVRRAAVRACADKDDRSLVEDLIGLLDDDGTAHVAREALKKLTGQDLPDAGSWHKWWGSIARADD
jgi:hypothetical protein